MFVFSSNPATVFQEMLSEVVGKETTLDKIESRYAGLLPGGATAAGRQVAPLRAAWTSLRGELGALLEGREAYLRGQLEPYHALRERVSGELEATVAAVDAVKTDEEMTLGERVRQMEVGDICGR